MNYYPFHIGDYRSHTAHLTRMQDLAYRRLLDLYYMHERSLPADPVQCARRIGMSDCLEDVRVVLEDFFVLDEIGHHNKRCDEILHEFTSRREKAQRAGIASGAARRAKAQQEEQALPPGSAHADHPLPPGSTDVERTLNERSTDAEHPFNECSRGVQPTNNQNQNQREKPLPPLPPSPGGMPTRLVLGVGIRGPRRGRCLPMAGWGRGRPQTPGCWPAPRCPSRLPRPSRSLRLAKRIALASPCRAHPAVAAGPRGRRTGPGCRFRARRTCPWPCGVTSARCAGPRARPSRRRPLPASGARPGGLARTWPRRSASWSSAATRASSPKRGAAPMSRRLAQGVVCLHPKTSPPSATDLDGRCEQPIEPPCAVAHLGRLAHRPGRRPGHCGWRRWPSRRSGAADARGDVRHPWSVPVALPGRARLDPLPGLRGGAAAARERAPGTGPA